MKKLALALGLTIALGACGGDNKAQAPASLSALDGVLITEGRLVLPAVKGHPAAAYFTVSNQSGAIATLTGVAVTGAGKAEMHVTQDGIMEAVPRLDIGAGQSASFGPGGKHAMVFDVSPALKAGGSTEVTLTFSDGRKLTSALRIENPGMMGAMDHSKM
jgi:copper(I)-binding protein